jgi:pimeloyl-ACP methyl ester carboxylesterase
MGCEAHPLAQPWGFSLAAIETETHLGYGSGDRIVPPPMGRYLAARRRRPVPHVLPGGGHFALVSHWSEILTALARP